MNTEELTPEKRHITEDVLGEFGFRLVWLVSDHWADVKAYAIETFDENGPRFWREGSSHNGDATPDHNDAETYLEGYVKWDGCSELDQGCPHWCGPRDYKKHMALLRLIYIRATELMGLPAEEPWEDDPAPSPVTVSQQPQASKLPSQWDAALLGATVSTVGEDQFVYSLRKLIMLVMNARKIQAPEARQVIYHEMIKPFSREVVFVNDELLEPVEEEKSRIVIPKNLGGRRWSK